MSPEAPTTVSIGAQAPDFDLPDTDGERHSLPAGEPAVVVFTCNHCPYALAWHDRIAAAARDYAGRGGASLRSTPTTPTATRADSYEAMQERVRADGGWPMPYLRDETQEVARPTAPGRRRTCSSSTPTARCATAAPRTPTTATSPRTRPGCAGRWTRCWRERPRPGRDGAGRLQHQVAVGTADAACRLPPAA